MDINEKKCGHNVKSFNTNGGPIWLDLPCVLEPEHIGDRQDKNGKQQTNHGKLKTFIVEWKDGTYTLIRAHRMIYSNPSSLWGSHEEEATVIFWHEYTTVRVVGVGSFKQAYEVTEPVTATADFNGVKVPVQVAFK